MTDFKVPLIKQNYRPIENYGKIMNLSVDERKLTEIIFVLKTAIIT